ncbi:MAG: hypothetical protein JO017_00410 [Actinobacteria bacterium]|nr:hypothetical protein [Actinomycetota bacterium]
MVVAAAAGLVLLRAAGAAPGVRATPCGSVTIPARITQSIPFVATDITVVGVTCTYAKTKFLPAIAKPGAGPPTGWTINLATVSGRLKQDTCRDRGGQIITFRFKL